MLFRSLRVRNYRLFASGQVISLTGTWMQRVAQDWLVVQLTHSNGTALGSAYAIQFLPTLLLGYQSGLLADRHNKRRLLIATQTAMGLCALALGLLVVVHAVRLWQVYLLALLLGVVSAADTPIRQAFVSELVGVKDVANAVSLNSATFNTARLIGPAIAGLLIEKMGTGPVFLANAGSYAAVLVGLLLMRDSELFQSTRQARSRGQLRAGVRYVLERPQLYLPLILVAVVCTLGLNFQITLALIAKKTFHRNAGTYGLLSSALAVGSLAGALLSARRGRPRGRLLVGAALTFGLLEIATGFMPTYWSFLALLIPTGVAALTFTTTANSTMQLNSAGNMRGRVMALYVLLFLGTAPFGAELVGWIAQTIGPRYSLIVGGVPSALTAVAVGLAMARASQVRIVPHLLRRRPHVHLRPIEVERVS